MRGSAHVVQLERLSVHNFKSLRDVQFSPEKFSVLIGPNGAGKTNLADAVDFIAEIFRTNLEVAVGNKGGVHNFWYRKERRSKGALQIELLVSFDKEHLARLRLKGQRKVYFEYKLTCRTTSASLASDVAVTSESIRLWTAKTDHVLSLRREGQQISIEPNEQFFREEPLARLALSDRLGAIEMLELEKGELLLTFAGLYVPALRRIKESIAGMRVFQLYPGESRKPGIMSATPELDRHGGNLPAILRHLRDRNHEGFEKILAVMKGIMPGLEDIITDYTLDRRLGLFFKEKGITRPWYADEVSDGTIRSLSILAAIADHRSSLVLLEEPENHVHPWILRRIYDFCAETAETKQVIITTHSPLFLNRLAPRQVFVVSRADHATSVTPLTELRDEEFLQDVLLGDFWQAGGIQLAVPLDNEGGTEE